MKNKTLGKGLGALFSQVEEFKSGEVRELNLSLVRPNPDQVRHDFDEKLIDELALSIKNHGLLEPILVTPTVDDMFMIVAGERRYRAFIKNKEEKIPAIIKKFSKQDIKKLSLIENIQRENLNPIEEALSYQELMQDMNMTQEEFSKEIGKSRSHIANSVRLLSLDDEVKELVRSGKLSFGHAKILTGLSKDEQKKLANKIVTLGLSVRETERETPKKKNAERKNILYKDLEESLGDTFMTKVKINDKKGKGKIEISYYSEDELTRLIEIFNRLWYNLGEVNLCLNLMCV